MFLKKKTHRNKQFFKKKGFVLVPVVLATFIIGMLGIGLSSLYSGTFGVMNSAKAASQAKQFATVEGDILKVAGYDGSTDVTHDWQSLQNVVGADGANWESKVEDTGRTETSPSGDQVKVMKVSVRKNNELVSRYSEEVPLVNGADTMSRAEIQALIDALQGQVNNLTSQLEALNGKVDNIQSQIDAINNQITVINTTIGALQKRVEDYHTELLNSIATEKAARESADIAEADARKAAISKEVNDRNAAIKASTDSLNSRINVLDGQIKELYNKVNNNSNAIMANTNNISANTNAINDIRQTMTKLRETIDINSGSIATIKSRLDGNEFIKNNSTENNIKIGWDGKALYGMVDGNKVPLSTQGGAFSFGKDIHRIPFYGRAEHSMMVYVTSFLNDELSVWLFDDEVEVKTSEREWFGNYLEVVDLNAMRKISWFNDMNTLHNNHVLHTSGRGKYGQGEVSATAFIPAGAFYVIYAQNAVAFWNE